MPFVSILVGTTKVLNANIVFYRRFPPHSSFEMSWIRSSVF